MESSPNKKKMPIFDEGILTKVITIEEVMEKLERDEALTPYHHQVLLLEISAREEAKAVLAKKLFLQDGTLSKAQKHAALRAELVGLIRDQQDLQKMLAHAKTLYYFFKKARAAGTVAPELSAAFKDTLDRLWAARREQQQLAREQDIENNLEKYLTGFNTQHHSA